MKCANPRPATKLIPGAYYHWLTPYMVLLGLECVPLVFMAYIPSRVGSIEAGWQFALVDGEFITKKRREGAATPTFRYHAKRMGKAKMLTALHLPEKP